MSDNQPARIRQGRETKAASAREGMGGAKGRKGSSKKEAKEVKEEKKVLTGSASRPLGVHGSDVQAQSSGVRVVINADGSETEWDEDWYNYLHSEEFARREE